MCLIFVTQATGEKFLRQKISRSTVINQVLCLVTAQSHNAVQLLPGIAPNVAHLVVQWMQGPVAGSNLATDLFTFLFFLLLLGINTPS